MLHRPQDVHGFPTEKHSSRGLDTVRLRPRVISIHWHLLKYSDSKMSTSASMMKRRETSCASISEIGRKYSYKNHCYWMKTITNRHFFYKKNFSFKLGFIKRESKDSCQLHLNLFYLLSVPFEFIYFIYRMNVKSLIKPK